MSADVVVRLDGLRKSFGQLEVVRGIDMEVHRGEVVVVFGRSGSGKSTVLRCINFIDDPSGGSVEVAGIRLEGGYRTRRKREQNAGAQESRCSSRNFCCASRVVAVRSRSMRSSAWASFTHRNARKHSSIERWSARSSQALESSRPNAR